jgi:hypothetical protein
MKRMDFLKPGHFILGDGASARQKKGSGTNAMPDPSKIWKQI